jgi:hypothetical protein
MTRKNPNVFSSGGSGSSSTNSTPVGTPYNSLQREERKPIQGHNLEASLKDADLDALLTDLCDFDPMKEMSSSKPLPTNPIQFSSPSHTVVAQTPPIPHARPTPPPPATQPVEPPIIQVMTNRRIILTNDTHPHRLRVIPQAIKIILMMMMGSVICQSQQIKVNCKLITSRL